MARNPFGRPSDGPTTMTTNTLDNRTAERLLRGALPPDDAPPGYGEVATLLQAARTEARATTSARSDESIAAMVAAIEARGSSAPVVQVRRRRSRGARLAAVVASTGLLALFGGMTAAGALPASAQDRVSTALAKVGIVVPSGHDGHGSSGSQVGTPSPATDETPKGNGAPSGNSTATSHGACVSQAAGSGGAAVKVVAQSDCGKPPTAGGPSADPHDNGNGPPGGAPPGQVKLEATPDKTDPPQSNSGGSGANGNGNGNPENPSGQAKKTK